MMFLRLALLTGLVGAAGNAAMASEIMMHKGVTITVPVNTGVGTVLEFPSPVQITVPSKNFSIKKVITEVDKKSRQAVNIRFFTIKPTIARAVDAVTFVFPNMRSVSMRFISQPGADKHHLFRFPNRRTKFSWDGNIFLENEIDMMIAMLRDESMKGFDKKSVAKKLIIGGYSDIEMILVRRFQGKGLLGYVFKIINTGDHAITINPAALNFDSPNRAALFQIDHHRLEPCGVDNSSDPRSNSCMAALRIVVRGNHYVMPASMHDLPFRIRRG